MIDAATFRPISPGHEAVYMLPGGRLLRSPVVGLARCTKDIGEPQFIAVCLDSRGVLFAVDDFVLPLVAVVHPGQELPDEAELRRLHDRKWPGQNYVGDLGKGEGRGQ